MKVSTSGQAVVHNFDYTECSHYTRTSVKYGFTYCAFVLLGGNF